jgi:hypothetical protein
MSPLANASDESDDRLVVTCEGGLGSLPQVHFSRVQLALDDAKRRVRSERHRHDLGLRSRRLLNQCIHLCQV